MSLETTASNEVPYQRNSEVSDTEISDKSFSLQDVHLNVVLVTDALFKRNVTVSLLKDAPFCSLSLQDIIRVRDLAYKAGVYSTPFHDPAAINAECLLELQRITKFRMKYSTVLHPFCFRQVVLMSAIAPDVVMHTLFQWLSEDHRILSLIVPFVADIFVSLGNMLSLNINSDNPLFLNTFYEALSSKSSKYPIPQPVLHSLCSSILSHSSNNDIVRIDQCFRFVILPLILEQNYDTACELLRQISTVIKGVEQNIHSKPLVDIVSKIVMLACSPFTIDSLDMPNNTKNRPSVEDVRNAVTIVELCERYVSQTTLRSIIERVSKHMPSTLIVRLVRCVVPPDVYSAKRESELLESLHEICRSAKPSLASYERMLTLSVLGPDFSVQLPLHHQYRDLKWNIEPIKSGLWIAALARQASIFSECELSSLFSSRLPVLLEVLWKDPPKKNRIPQEGSDPALFGCQLGLQAAIATQHVPTGNACQSIRADIALKLCRAVCAAIIGRFESLPGLNSHKCDYVYAATSLLFQFLMRTFEKSSHEWPGRSFCADVVKMTLLELLRKFGVEVHSVKREGVEAEINNLRDLILQFGDEHVDATPICHAAMSAFQSQSELA